MSRGVLQGGPTAALAAERSWWPQCHTSPAIALFFLLVTEALAFEVSYCLPHPERPCWGVQCSLSERSGTDSPFHGLDLGYDAQCPFCVQIAVALHAADWNGDGLLDLLVGQSNGTVRFFQGSAGGLSEQTAGANPFAGISAAGDVFPHAVDWDDDGHMDLLLGVPMGPGRFFRGQANGSLSEQMGVSSPIAGIGDGWVTSFFLGAVDWDGDGRQDLLVGADGGAHLFRRSADGNLSGSVVVDPSTGLIFFPQAVDWDGDGRMDVLGVSGAGVVRFFRGSDDGSISEQTGTASPFAGLPWVTYALHAVDWDGDGRMDLLLLDLSNTLHFLQGGIDDSLREQARTANPFRNSFTSLATVPEVVDWDGDGRKDLVLGSFDGTVRFFGGASDGSMSERTGAANPFGGIVSERSSPQAVDWDRDGRLDLLLGGGDGTVRLFQASADGRLYEQTGAANPFAGVYTEEFASPHAIDWNGDGRLDLLLGNRFGELRFFLGGANGSVSEVRGVANPIAGISGGPHATPHVVDWDGDGLLDLLVGNSDGRLQFFQGGADGSLSEKTGMANPFADVNVESDAAPRVVDWDGDGRKDLLVGAWSGGVRLFSAQCDSSALGQRSVCSSAGACEPFFGRCRCAASNEHPEASDCSVCASFFHKERGNPLCQPCPGADTSQGPCLGRGKCWDTQTAREALREGAWMPAQWYAPGTGTCACEAPFFGSNCGEGECPAGSGLVESRANGSAQWYLFQESCASCAAGQYKAAAGNAQCDPCLAGMFQSESGATACDPCPGGTKQSSSGSSRCDTCTGGSAPNAPRTACEACTAGRYASGQDGCSVCEAGLVPTPERSGCRLCAEGSAPSANQTECEPCVAGRYASPGQESCALCPAGLVPTPDRGRCQPCAAGKVPSTNRSECEECRAGRYANSGQESCARCDAGRAPADDRGSCRQCAAGKALDADQTACEACSPGRQAGPGQSDCSPCQDGLVPTPSRTGCEPCDSGWFVAEGEWQCRLCPMLYTSEAGSSSCWLHQAVVPAILSLLCILAAGSLRWLLRRRWRRAITLAVQCDSALKLREALERGSRIGLGRADLQPARRCLQVLDRKYVDHEYLLKIVEKGDLKLVKGSWLADERNGQRLRRQQDLPQEAFWAVDDLRSELRAVLFVAVSYCWLQEVHPDPGGIHLRTLRHAIRLRLCFQGPGQVVDIALFLDYCSLAQHGEKGDPTRPERGDFRTPEQQTSFARGLRQVNIPYANQSVEVWMMQWVPDDEERKYMKRGWPYFEQAVAALIKDAAQLLLIMPESQRCQDWLELHRAAVGGRQPPLTPAQFCEQIACKTFTSPGTDRALVIRKYEETFHDVLGHAETLCSWRMCSPTARA